MEVVTPVKSQCKIARNDEAFSKRDQFCSFWDQFCRFTYLIRLVDHFCGSTGWQKCLHVSRGLLRNEAEVKWHSVGSTMTSIVGDVTQTYS